MGPLEDRSFKQRPSENEWSVAEILCHLCLVEERVLNVLEKSLTREPQKAGLLKKLIPMSLVASRAVRVKAPQGATPQNPLDKDAGLEAFNTVREKLKALYLTQGKSRLRQVCFKHPFMGAIDGVAAVSFVGYHELRHYKQICEVLRKQDFAEN